MFKEFQAFIRRGNVLDLAVAVIIGGAFGSIVNSLVGDIIMPLLGIVLNGIHFTGLSITVGSAVVSYGNFIAAVINFLVIAFVIFILIRQVRRFEKPVVKVPAALPEPSPEEKLLAEIRDILKHK